MKAFFSRRKFITGLISGVGVSALTGCDRLVQDEHITSALRNTEKMTLAVQRLLGRNALAQEFSEADISENFFTNGTTMPDSNEYAALLKNGFANWRLKVDGLVNQPLSLSLTDLQRFPTQTQITRHDCVEGWSSIGKWHGVKLGQILQTAGLKPSARYVIFHCADELEQTLDGSGRYYESIDLVDAFHPQTILAWGMNGKALPVAHGAPLRLRVERQLGYKQAKYLMHLEVVSSFDTLWGGKGGYWEDRGYEWYGGI